MRDLAGAPRLFVAIARTDMEGFEVCLRDEAWRVQRYRGMTPLMFAAYWASFSAATSPALRSDVVRTLLERGADANELFLTADGSPGSFEASARHHGFTALLFSVFYNDVPEVVQALLDGGARFDLQSASGWTALDLAIHFNRRDAATILRRAGATSDYPAPIR